MLGVANGHKFGRWPLAVISNQAELGRGVRVAFLAANGEGQRCSEDVPKASDGDSRSPDTDSGRCSPLPNVRVMPCCAGRVACVLPGVAAVLLGCALS